MTRIEDRVQELSKKEDILPSKTPSIQPVIIKPPMDIPKFNLTNPTNNMEFLEIDKCSF